MASGLTKDSNKETQADQAKLDKFAKENITAIGIDIGGTKIRSAVVQNRKLVCEPVQISTPQGADAIVDDLLKLIGDFQKKYGNAIQGVGIATAGVVDTSTGKVIGSTGNLPGWAGTDLKSIIESKTLLPVHVENDANAAGFGEASTEQIQGKKCVMAVTLGTGIGGGIIIDGELYRGASWAAGEVGHLKIANSNERLCTCGLFDCWEAFGAGRGIIMTAKEMLKGVTPQQSPLAMRPESVSTHAIFAAAGEDDIIAKKVVEKWHEHLAIGMSSLIHVLNPDCFILAGGLVRFVQLEMLKEMTMDRTIPGLKEKFEIHLASLGSDAGVIGVSQLVINKLAKSGNSK